MEQVIVPPAGTAGFVSTSGSNGSGWERTAERVRGQMTDAERGASEQSRELAIAVEKIGAAAALAAAKDQAESLRVNAVAFCEVKELIRADGEKTRDLISAIEAKGLAIELSDAKAQILALKVAAGKVI